jgi:hypothetical protein
MLALLVRSYHHRAVKQAHYRQTPPYDAEKVSLFESVSLAQLA